MTAAADVIMLCFVVLSAYEMKVDSGVKSVQLPCKAIVHIPKDAKVEWKDSLKNSTSFTKAEQRWGENCWFWRLQSEPKTPQRQRHKDLHLHRLQQGGKHPDRKSQAGKIREKEREKVRPPPLGISLIRPGEEIGNTGNGGLEPSSWITSFYSF